MIIVIRAKGEEVIKEPDVIEVPILKPMPDEQALSKLRELCSRRWDVVVFMSSVAAEYMRRVINDPCWVNCLAVGPSTGLAVKELFGVECAIPRDYSSIGLLELLRGMSGDVLVVRSMEHSGSLFTELGSRVTEVGVYRLTLVSEELTKLSNILNVEESHGGNYAVIVTSPRVAREVANLLRGLRHAVVVAIGPVTSGELRRLGIGHVVAEVHTISGAVNKARMILSERG